MSARSVQISIDEELLARIDRRRDVRRDGRSRFIRRAVELYLEIERRREIDDAYARAYGGDATAFEQEMADLVGAQAWPDE